MSYSPEAFSPELMFQLSDLNLYETTAQEIAEGWMEDPAYNPYEQPGVLVSPGILDFARSIYTFKKYLSAVDSVQAPQRGETSDTPINPLQQSYTDDMPDGIVWA